MGKIYTKPYIPVIQGRLATEKGPLSAPCNAFLSYQMTHCAPGAYAFLCPALPTMAATRLSYSSCRCARFAADSRSLKSLCLSTFLKSSRSASSLPASCSRSYLRACSAAASQERAFVHGLICCKIVLS